MSGTGRSEGDEVDVDVAEALAQIEKGQQMAGHFPSSDDLAAARRILTGETTADEEVAQVLAKYRTT